MKNISFKDFQKVDIRIGMVVKAEVPDWSHWVMKLTVDFGGGIASEAKSAEDRSSRRPRSCGAKSREVRSGRGDEMGERIIFAGILGFYKAKDLEGKQYPFIVNLEPKKIGPKGDYSEGMLLAGVIDVKDDPTSLKLRGASEKPVLLEPSEKVPNGTKIS